MKDKTYAIMGDIHGNWEALSTVLADAQEQGVNSYMCVGDVVGYNADPAKCLEKIQELDCIVVRGNHDHYCSHDECLDDFHPMAANVVDWTREQLTDEEVSYLKNLRYSRIHGGFTLVHATLDMPDKWGYVFDNLEADSHFNYQTTSLCFHGHTHVPVVYEKSGGRVHKIEYKDFKLELGRKYFINVGSVGQPRDGDPRSCYVIYDFNTKSIKFRRLEYDIEATQAKIRQAGLPDRLARRLEAGK